MSSLPDFEAIAIFAKIVEAHGLGAAAIELGLSTPTVSKALTRLERRLGSRLINRTSRRLVLTEAGQRLAERAARLLAEAEAAENVLRDDAAALRGQVRLTAPMSFGVQEVAPLLPEFMLRYPDVSIDLHLSDAWVDIVGDRFDMALRIGELVDSTLRVRKLGRVARVVVAAPSYLARYGQPMHPSDLMQHACFGYAYHQSRNAWQFRNAGGDEVTVCPSGPLRVNHGEAALPALIAGLGIAQAPHIIVRDALARGQLQEILLGWTLGDAGLHLLMPAGGHRPARVTALADFLMARLASICGQRTSVVSAAEALHAASP